MLQANQLLLLSQLLSAFFSCLARSKYLSIFFFHFHSAVGRHSKICKIFFFKIQFKKKLIKTNCGLLVGIGWSVCFSKSQRISWVSFSKTDSGLCIYILLVWSKSNLLYNSQWITFPTQSCLASFSFFRQFATFAYDVIKRFTSSHNLRLLLHYSLRVFSYQC